MVLETAEQDYELIGPDVDEETHKKVSEFVGLKEPSFTRLNYLKIFALLLPDQDLDLEDRIVAALYFNPSLRTVPDDVAPKEGTATLGALKVREEPEFIRKGLASRLVRELEQHLRELGVKHAITTGTNEKSAPLFEKLGWEPVRSKRRPEKIFHFRHAL